MAYPGRNLKLLALTITSLPFTVLARRGGSRGGGSASGNVGIGGSDSSGNLSLEPVDAAIFAFSVIFAIFTALQAIYAAFNIYKRTTKQPPSITLPEFTLGPIFPTFLFLSTLALTAYYVLTAIFWGLAFNQNARSSRIFPFDYINALTSLSVIYDTLLISALLALISHREKVLLGNNSDTWRYIKTIINTVLIATMLALGMAYVGVRTTGRASRSRADNQTAENVYGAYISFVLIAAVVVAGSSAALYARAKRSLVNDNQIVRRTAFIISPLLIVHAIFPIISWKLMGNATRDEGARWNLAAIIILCVTMFIIITLCLRFGIPVTAKQNKTPLRSTSKGDVSPHKEYQDA